MKLPDNGLRWKVVRQKVIFKGTLYKVRAGSRVHDTFYLAVLAPLTRPYDVIYTLPTPSAVQSHSLVVSILLYRPQDVISTPHDTLLPTNVQLPTVLALYNEV